MGFYVYELIEETVDVLEIGIDSSPIIAGYYVLAFNPNDENAREYVVENGMEVLYIKIVSLQLLMPMVFALLVQN